MKTVKLNTGHETPLVGIGTWRIKPEDIYKTIDGALKAGYRSIDTASVYGNESAIGAALKELLPKYGLQRQDIFITSKLAPVDQGADKCRECVMKSLSNLGIDYIDLYFVHWPATRGFDHTDTGNPQRRLGSYRDLEKLHKEGIVRSIGVSNYLVRHMEELFSHCEIKPAVLQIEFHPHLLQEELRALCRENGIHFQAYSSLGAGKSNLLEEPDVVKLAEKYKKTPAQVLLRWAVQQNIGIIPKSTNPARIRENMDIFDFSLTDEEIQSLKSLEKGVHYCWDPTNIV